MTVDSAYSVLIDHALAERGRRFVSLNCSILIDFLKIASLLLIDHGLLLKVQRNKKVLANSLTGL